ncbi:MAG: fibronectin type III domain-containing protein [Verrucomicrobiaceae bacterium]|nr:fibronectin type III domain-containing protein [Verrucomicrobiaceae bacterium]
MANPLNPHYDDPAVFYDAGFFYADGVPDTSTPNPPSRRNRIMNLISAGLSRKNSGQLIDLADLVIPKLAPAAPATPPVPNIAAKVATLTTQRAATKTAHDNYEAAKAELVALKNIRDEEADKLRLEHGAVISAIESEAKGNVTMAAASGYPLASPSTTSTTPPAQITNLALTAGDADGSVDGTHDPDPLARSYEAQVTTVDPVAGPWVTMAQPTASNFTLTGLTSGQRIWVRVRGIGANGPGPWSDPATKIVP